MSLYALNLVDLAGNQDFRAYSRRSLAAVARYGGEAVALGRHVDHPAELGDTPPRKALVLVRRPDRRVFDAFLADPELHDPRPPRENGNRRTRCGPRADLLRTLCGPSRS